MLTYHFDLWILLGFVAQVALPLVVGLVSTKVTPPDVRWILMASLTAVISLVTSVLSAHASGSGLDLFQAGLTALAGLLVSVASHFGVWNPSGIAEKALNARLKTPPAN